MSGSRGSQMAAIVYLFNSCGCFKYQPDDYCLLYELLRAEISRQIRLEKETVKKCKPDGYQPTSIGGGYVSCP